MRIGRPIPFEAARAYGIKAGKPSASPNQARGSEDAGQVFDDRIGQRTLPSNIARLVAGVVPGGIDFREGDALPTDPGSMAMYSRAGERNAAATGVIAGRLLDVQA